MAFVGEALSIFDHDQTDWIVFKCSLHRFFLANYIQETKKAILVSHLSDNTYNLMRKLAKPKNIDDFDYLELTALLDKHFMKRGSFVYKHRFFTATKDPSETIKQWAVRLENIAALCDFGEGLEVNLRDRFLIGLNDGLARDRLSGYNPIMLTFKLAVDIAMKAECRPKVVPAVPAPDEVMPAAGSSAGTSGNPRQQNKRPACGVCGRDNHNQSQCRLLNYKCYKCGKKGHLKNVCTYGKRK